MGRNGGVVSMETDNEESVRLSPEAYLQKAQEMLADPEFSPTAKERSKLILALKFLPLLTGIGNNVIGIGSAIAQLIAIEKSISNALRATSHTIADSFQYAGIAFAALDFIRIPALYLSSWMLGEKSPVTLSKNARWLYAGILLGLAITALAVPAAAAPIALLTGVMGLGVSIFSMAWFFQRRQEVRQELNKINKAIKGENAKLKTLQEQAKEYESKLQEAIKAKNKEVIQEYTAKIEKLHQAFASQKEKLQNLHERKEKYEKKKLKRGMGGLADKTVGVGLSALALIGLVTYLYFPPAGLGILLAGAAIGTLYIVARVTYPLIKNFAAWIREKISAPTSKEEGVQ